MFQPAVRAFASLKLTLLGMAALAVGALVSYNSADAHLAWLLVPLGLLSGNLLAALLFNPRFRRQGGLMVFHLGLLLVLVFAAWGRLTHLDARLEITEGQQFDATQVMVDSRGPTHPWALDRVVFEQAEVEVDYAPGLRRGHTRSWVRVPAADGGAERVSVGDDSPLTANSYRFYTTSNKGFAVVLTWLGDGGEAVAGAIHLPSYPLLDWKQVNSWLSPAGQEIEVELLLPGAREEARAWTLNGSVLDGAVLRVRPEAAAKVLAAGEAVGARGGRLRFEGVRMWMGYKITYDPILPWLFAAALVAVLGLAWHFWGKLWSRPLVEGVRGNFVREQGGDGLGGTSVVRG